MSELLNLFDSHTHSDNSPDGEHSVTFMCEQAVSAGLMGFAVTDHCEIDQYRADSYQLRMIQSVFEVRKAQLYFGDGLMLTAGVELGQPLSDPECARKVLELHNYDFVLGSVHTLRGRGDFYFMDYASMSGEEIGEVLGEYFEEVLRTVRWGGFDVLAHLTYPLRYIEGRAGIPCDLSAYAPLIDEILSALAHAGMGLEYNASGLYGPHGKSSPEPDVLRRFRQLGGEIVTIGSDAHRAQDIGRGVEDGMRVVRECGFTKFAFFKNRRPRLLDIR